MLKELEIYDFGTYVEVITQIDAEQQYRMWFRGQSDYSWGLVPSVQRKDGMGKNYEQYISTNFMIHTMRLNPNAPQRYDRASWLTLMQHYGLPTRLLDWSESPLVALYFALSSDEDAKTDAAVWVLNPMRLNKKVGYPPLIEKPVNQKPSLHQMEHYQKFYENGEYVRAVESTTEQNYNMIDGCANNLPKPRIINGRESVLDKLRIRQMAREKQKSGQMQEQSTDIERNRK